MVEIYNTDTGEIHEIQMFVEEGDILSDIIDGCNRGEWVKNIPDDMDVNFAMTDKEIAWWERWAKREEVINERYHEGDDETRDLIVECYDDEDMEAAQDKVYELLGIEE